MDDPIVLTELSSIYRNVFITPESVEALGYEFEGGEKKNYDGYKLYVNGTAIN